MKIQSNIQEVISRLNRVDAEVPEAVARAIAPVYWTPRLKAAALRVLREQWGRESNATVRAQHERMVPRIVETIMGQVFERGSFFTMSLPRDAIAATDIEQAAEYQSSIRTPTGRYKRMPDPTPEEEQASQQNQENLNRVRQLILDWVMLEKRLTPEEQNEAPERVAEKIEVILGLRPHETLGMARSERMKDAAEAIAGALKNWMEGEGESGTNPEMAAGMRAQGLSPQVTNVAGFPVPLGSATVSPEVALRWLEAALEAWVKLLAKELPGRIREEVAKTMGDVKRET